MYDLGTWLLVTSGMAGEPGRVSRLINCPLSTTVLDVIGHACRVGMVSCGRVLR
jgi:hypothetical protein